jgi:hypothetical protein
VGSSSNYKIASNNGVLDFDDIKTVLIIINLNIEINGWSLKVKG